MMARERSGGRWWGVEGDEGGVYLSLGEQDVGDDVREAAAEHQHHAVLAVGDTGHLQMGRRYLFSAYFYGIGLVPGGHYRALTSAPRRLSEHILQKESRACRKAGDNFLQTHKQCK